MQDVTICIILVSIYVKLTVDILILHILSGSLYVSLSPTLLILWLLSNIPSITFNLSLELVPMILHGDCRVPLLYTLPLLQAEPTHILFDDAVPRVNECPQLDMRPLLLSLDGFDKRDLNTVVKLVDAYSTVVAEEYAVVH